MLKHLHEIRQWKDNFSPSQDNYFVLLYFSDKLNDLGKRKIKIGTPKIVVPFMFQFYFVINCPKLFLVKDNNNMFL